MKKHIAGVVVLYYPPESVIENIQSYAQDIGLLVVFDNSPGYILPGMDAVLRQKNVEYLTQGANIGIGAALNSAARNAVGRGYRYLLTMDQDSRANPGMVRSLFTLAEQNPSAGIVTPFHIVQNDVRPPSQGETELLLTAMASGNLLRLEAFNTVGGFDEKLFIDYVDHEYCFRLQQHGFSVIRANTVFLNHTVGRLQEKKIFGQSVHPPHHSPVRLYYQTRNYFFVRRLYRKQFPDFFKNDGKTYRRRIIKMLLFDTDRLQKMRMIIKGFCAFLRNDFSMKSGARI